MKSISLRIGDWLADPLTGEISGSQGSKHLEPKVMQVLICLASNAGEVVTRDEILSAVWGPRAVSDEPLTRCIQILRKALDDSSVAPEYIRTIPKIGYMMIAEVESQESLVSEEQDGSADKRPEDLAQDGRNNKINGITRNHILIFAVVVAIIAAGFVFVKVRPPVDKLETVPDSASIAVLPFSRSESSRPGDYFIEGVAEELRLILGQVPNLRVVAAQSSSIFADSKEDIRAIASKLDVRYLVSGTVQPKGTAINVFVQLVDGSTGFQLWSDKYSFRIDEIFAVQTRISNSVVDALVDVLVLPGTTPRFDIREPTQSVEAFDLFLHGRYFLNLRNPASLIHAKEKFESAIAADPAYGMPYVALAYTISLLPHDSREEQERLYRQARETLRSAVDIDPTVRAAAEGIEAFIDLREWRLVASYSEYRNSLEQFPNEPILHHGYSLLMSTVGMSQEALDHALIARDLDSLSPVANSRLAIAYLWTGDNEKAAHYFNIASDLGLDTALHLEAYILLLLRTSQFEKAKDVGARLHETHGLDHTWFPDFVDAIANAELRHIAITSLENAAMSQQVMPLMQFGAWALLGEHERAVDVAKDLRTRSAFIGGILFAEDFKAIRKSERYVELLQQTGILRFWREFGWSQYCQELHDGEIVCS